MITPAATWKGSLRMAAVERLIVGGSADQIEDRITLRDLFGDEKAEDTKKGRAMEAKGNTS